jgi:hypothetical protein
MITDKINGITRLTASDGMVLTNGDSHGTEVWLAPTALASDWREISEGALLEESDPESIVSELEELI